MPLPLCRFEYLYRDASNYKGHGSVALVGEATAENETAIRAVLIDRMYFEAEQVGIPTLYHLVQGDGGPEEVEDHGWHEFVGLAPEGDSPALETLGSLQELLTRLRGARQ